MNSRRLRAAAALVAAVLTAAVAGSGSAARTAGSVQLVQSPLSNFPDMVYSLGLPSDTKLSANQVHVTENGRPVNDASIEKPGADSQGTVLLIDASKSMSGRPIRGAMAAARAFSERRNPGQKLAVVFFNNGTTVKLPITSDQTSIDAALSKPPTLDYGTHIYDGLQSASDVLTNAGIENGAIILLSDGKDVGSTVDQAAAIAAVNGAKARVYAVGLKSPQYDPNALRNVAAQTAGTYNEAANSKELSDVYTKLGYTLSNEYVLRYRSLAGPSTKLVVAVKVDDVPGTARTAYTSPALPVVAPAEQQTLWDRFIQSPLTLIGLILLIVSMVAYAVFRLVYHPHDALTRRIGQFVTLPEEERAERHESALTALADDERRPKDGRLARLEDDMAIAGITMTARTLIILSIIIGFVVGVFVSLLIGSPIGILAIVLGPLLARSWVNIKLRNRRKAFADQLPENLDVLSSGLRAGHSMTGALAVCIEDAAEPGKTEFRRVIADEQLGIPIDEALHVTGRRMANRDIVQVALVAKLQRDAGTNAADVLDQVSLNIRNRLELRRLIASLTAQGRLARWIVSALPLVLFLAIYTLNKDYLRPLWTEPIGITALIIAALMVCAGSYIIKRIIEIEV